MAEKKNIKKISRNLWEGRFYYLNNDSQKKYKEYFGKSKKEVETKLKQLEKFFGKEPIKMTCNEVFDIWLLKKRPEITPKSFDQYKTRLGKYVKPYLGEKNFFEITKKDLEKFEEDLYENLKVKTVINIMQVTKEIFKFFEFEENNSRKINQKNLNTEIVILNSKDTKKLIDYANKNVNGFTLAMMIVLYSGISLSEVAALKWSDIDFSKRFIKINKVFQRIGNTVSKGSNKTQLLISKIPEREIPISKELLEYLNKFYLRNGYISTGTEKPMESRTLQYRLKSVCKTNNFTPCTFSVLRNTFIVKAMQSGCNIVLLENILKIEFKQLERYFDLIKISDKRKISQISKIKY